MIAAFEYAQNAQLSAENQRLKKELSDSSQRLLALETRLNQTQGEVAKLQIDITDLREQLRIASSITVGLTFLWQTYSPPFDVYEVVKYMNDVQWADTGVYFFVRHAGSEDFMPGGEYCQDIASIVCSPGTYCGNVASWTPKFKDWAPKAWNLYPETDVPVGIFPDVGFEFVSMKDLVDVEGRKSFLGCVWGTEPKLDLTKGWVVVALGWDRLDPKDYTRSVAMVLSHELLHVFGFSEEELGQSPCLVSLCDFEIPTAWIPRIQAAAKAFETRPPQPGSG